MKDNVFIAWSGNQELAIKIQSLLKKKDYLCFVGGNYKENPTDIDFSGVERSAINNTVRNQIDYCNHAIVLIQNKPQEKSSMISGNLCYELGYLSAKYHPSNIHTFFIDFNSTGDPALPSDIHGTWGVLISSSEKSIDELAEEIVGKFFEGKNITIYKSKMQDINYYRHIDYAIDVHLKQPTYSDHELAKHLLFYVQAAFIYQEWKEPERKCSHLYSAITQNEKEKSTELDIVLNYALLTFELFDIAIPGESNNKTSISGTKFRDMLKEYKSTVSLLLFGKRDEKYDLSNINLENTSLNLEGLTDLSLEDHHLPNEEFNLWFITQTQQHVTYLFSAFFNSEAIDLDDKTKFNYLNEAIKIGLAAVKTLKELEKNPSNSAYAILLLGYVYRNLASFYELLGDKSKLSEYQLLSYNMRNELYAKKHSSWNIDLQNYISLEYFLQKLEKLEDETDPYERKDSIQKTDEFIQNTQKYYKSKMFMFSQLVGMLEDIKKRNDMLN